MVDITKNIFNLDELTKLNNCYLLISDSSTNKYLFPRQFKCDTNYTIVSTDKKLIYTQIKHTSGVILSKQKETFVIRYNEFTKIYRLTRREFNNIIQNFNFFLNDKRTA